jgi:hypothetical protein
MASIPGSMIGAQLDSLPGGPALAAATALNMRLRSDAPAGGTATAQLNLASDALSLTWGDLCARHPEWLGDYWAECRALYAGGQRLLADPALMKRLFPQNLYEDAAVYEQRKRRAHYYPYPGTIIDHLLAGLGTDPLKVSFTLLDADDGKAQEPDAKAKWWQEWVSDVTDEAERPADYGLEDTNDEDEDDEGGRSIHRFCVDTLREALQTRTAWVLADLPRAGEEEPGEGLDPYLRLIPAEQVVDWQYDDEGRLTWAMVLTCAQIRLTPKDRRKAVRHTFVVWDAYQWLKYVIDVDPAKPPHVDEVFRPIDGGPHAFGRVPLECLALPEGLYAMGKLHCLAKEHLNKRCAMGWAEYRSLFAQLYEFLGPSDGSQSGTDLPTIASDQNRTTNQVRGVGYTQTRAAGDDARYVGIDPAVFVAARESCNDAMREMHRVMFSMALSANMDNAALQRSGESKQQDHATTAVVLDALAALLHPFVRRLFVLASLGRGEAVPKASITGLESFDVTGVNDAIALAIDVFNGIPQKSPRFAELFLSKTYGTILGDVPQDDAELIREQIRESLTAEEMAAEAMQAAATAGGAVQPGANPPAGAGPVPPAQPKPAAKPARAKK